MSKITEIIFKGKEHYITSKFGYRTPISTKAGTTSSKHKGTDYGTNGKKLPQYAIEDGEVIDIGIDGAGAKYVKVDYPRIKKRFLHWHLDTISVKEGQAVKKYTKLGTTGMTGKATGIHLHLGIIDLKNDTYIDPEAYAKEYNEPSEAPTKSVHQVAQEVLEGKWGNGADRRKRLEAASYSYTAVQAEVNNILYGKKKKSVTDIAKECIQGLHGNGAARKKKITELGYNYNEVQKKVNELLK
jgi:murein DD-endopeptidase MepM/ murein hydrolase activator NlpD